MLPTVAMLQSAPTPRPKIQEPSLLHPVILAYWVAIGLILYGVALLALQCFVWLKHGAWAQLPVTYVLEPPDMSAMEAEIDPVSIRTDGETPELRRLEGLRLLVRFVPDLGGLTPRWFSAPQSWHGLHRLVRSTFDGLSVPGLAALLGIGLVFLGLSLETGQDRSREDKNRPSP